ncbi:hypothetical protein [Hydrogenophaga sp. 5NK40-0174]|uniref:hypothetical protein n=1 Tax=Hydrogenophaga sp. 5NK40-0174 TaxID=3127649 RepID=UPI00310BAB1D
MAELDASSGAHFVFLAHFDGTNNDKNNLALADSQFSTNVGLISDLAEPIAESNPNFGSYYQVGVGANPGEGGWAAGVDPNGSMRGTAERAYDKFAVDASAWLREHPDANPEEALQVVATGFSRGSGTAALFSQLLYERGLADATSGEVLVPPGRLGLSAAMIYDPVTTGQRGNDAFSPTSQNITVVQAQNEYRTPFQGVDHSDHPGVTVVPVMGNHCDIGGGYDQGIAAMVAEDSLGWLKRSGLDLGDLPADRQFDGQAVVHHERDMPIWGSPDYPVTHEPTDGLDAPRQLTGDAREASTSPSGWRQFEGMDGTVYTKSFTHPNTGEPLEVTLVQQNGVAGYVEMYTSRLDDQGRVEATEHRTLKSAPVWDIMDVADQRMAPRAPEGRSHAAAGEEAARQTQQADEAANERAEADPNADVDLPPHLRPLPITPQGSSADNVAQAQEQDSHQTVAEEALAR